MVAKHGGIYTTKEVAQILKVHCATINNWIAAGKMEALMSSDHVEAGHRRTIRITRKQLSDFLKQNFMRFDNQEYAAFIIQDKDTGRTQEQTKDDPFCDGVAYTAKRLEDLTGAWAMNVTKKTETQEQINVDASPSTATAKTDNPTYTLSIDGRISLGNISIETCEVIFAALSKDKSFQFDEITFKKNRKEVK